MEKPQPGTYPLLPGDVGETVRQVEQGHPAVLAAGQHELPGLMCGQAVDRAGVDLQRRGGTVLLVENILGRQ